MKQILSKIKDALSRGAKLCLEKTKPLLSKIVSTSKNAINWLVALPKSTQIISAVAAVIILIGSTTGIIIATSHKHEYAPVVKNPTCTEQGYTTYTCECGDSYISDYVSALGHVEVVDSPVPATCTENGLTEGKHCSTCNDIIFEQEIISALGHETNNEWIVDVEPTCTTDGSKYTSCTRCMGKADVVKIAANGHSFDDWTQTLAPTCLENGSEYRNCTSCEHNETRVVNAKGHTSEEAVVENKTNATCTTDGKYDNVVYCSECDSEISRETVVVPMLGHNYISVVTPPIKGNDGYTTHTCELCNDSYTDSYIPYSDSEGLAYEVNSNGTTCTITGIGTCADTEVYIPRTINGLTVTAIGEKAFAENMTITFISVSDTVTTIGRRAFYKCSELTEVTIPESVTEIGVQIFYGCNKLHTVYYNSQYRSSENVFLNIDSINTIVFGGETIPNDIASNIGTVKEIIISENVKSIGDYAFYGCSGLTSITISNSVESIGNYAFSGCSELTSITIPNSVKSIGNYAFSGCSGLTSITIPNSVKSIGDYVFSGCSKVTNIAFEENIKLTTIGSNAFKNCTNLTNITIPESVTKIGTQIFYGCNNLHTVYYNSPYGSSENVFLNVDNINTIVFGGEKVPSYIAYNISSLKEIIISENVNIIGDYAFSGCSRLTSITIPDSVISIKSYAFSNCSGLTSITIPDSVTSIGSFAFLGCYRLIEVINKSSLNIVANSNSYGHVSYYAQEVHNGITKIENHNNYIFYTCSGTDFLVGYTGTDTVLTLPDSYINENYVINQYAFLGCNNLTSIIIPDSVTSIGDCAFRGCSSITDVVIPDSVTYIGDSAFSGCSSLMSITLPFVGDSIKTENDTYQYPFGYIFGTSSYTGGTATTQYYHGNSTSGTLTNTYYIPSNLRFVTITGGAIPYGAFSNCYNIYTVEIGDSVTSIGLSAFSGCSKLISITLPFVGNSAKTENDTYQYPFGYIFGTKSYMGGVATTQYYYGSSTNSIVYTTFYIPSNLMSVTITGGNILYGAFSNCYNIYTVEIGDSVTSIGDYAFQYCSSLTSVVIGDSVTSIGDYAFQYCSKLTDLAIGDKVTSISDYAFYNCSSLTSVVIPDSVTTIGKAAFYGCSSLTSAVIGDSVTFIGYNAFTGCSKLSDVYIKNVETWLNIRFDGSSHNHLTDGKTLHIINDEVEEEINLVIPSSVTSIPNYAFLNANNITSVTIPDSVTTIGDYAFRSCSSLTSVVIPDSVTTIGKVAFYGCSSLTRVVIGDSVTSIGDYAFSGCSSLTSVVIGDSVTSIGDYAFRSCSSLTSVVIPDSVTSIGLSAFSGCSGLINITLPFVGDSIKTENDTYQYPFGYIFGTSGYTGGVATTQYYYGSSTNSPISMTYYIPSSLKSVTITGGNILYGAFYNCSNITNVVIDDSVTYIALSAFYGCSGLEDIILPFVGDSIKTKNDAYQYPFGYIFGTNSYTGSKATEQYYYGSSTNSPISTTYYIPSSLKSVTITRGNILYGAFYNCSSITGVEIPNSVTSIGNYAFSGCSSITSVVIPDSVTSIGNYAFQDCSKLTSVVIGDSVTSIGQSAFSGCSSITSVVIPDSVTSIGKYAFSGCSSITSVVIPDSVTSIGQSAFQYCSKLTDLAIGDKVTSISDYAFYDCSSLTSVEIPNSVTSIGNYAFSGCSSITSVVIGDSVTSIGNYAFSGCSSITSVVIPDSVTSIGSQAFSDCSSITSVVIPDSVTSIGSQAFQYCSKLTSVVIGDSVTYIGSSAFYNTAYYKDDNNWVDGVLYISNHLIEAKYTISGKYVIRDGTITIADGAFEGCSSLTSVVIPDSVTSIGYEAFYYCTSLTSVVISDSVTSIGNRAFYYCTSLTSVTIPDSVTSIGYEAFYYCTSLTSVVIPNSVTTIGSHAFRYCPSLTTIYCEAKSCPTDWDTYWYDRYNYGLKIVWGYKADN